MRALLAVSGIVLTALVVAIAVVIAQVAGRVSIVSFLSLVQGQ